MKFAKTFFAQQLRKALYKRNFTQKDLAQKLEINRPMVNRWATGESYPSFNSLKKISSVLDVPLSYFTEEKPTDGKPRENINIENNSSKTELLEEKIKRFELEITLLKKDVELLKTKNEFLESKLRNAD